MIDLTKAKAICQSATPGPWIFSSEPEAEALTGDEGYGATTELAGDRDLPVISCWAGLDYDCGINISKHDAALISFARTALPQAIEEIERLRKWNNIEVERVNHELRLNYDQLKKTANKEIDSLRKRLELAEAVCRYVSSGHPDDEKLQLLQQAWRAHGGSGG